VPQPGPPYRDALILLAGVGLPLIALGGRLILFAMHSLAMVAFPWQMDYDEGVILNASWRLAQGQSPYPPLTPDQFISSVYSPLFYALNALALKIWGLNLWSGRGLSLLGTLLAAGALIVWAAAETRSRGAGIVGAALWLALGPVIVWATFYKQDILALAFGVLGAALIAYACPPQTAPAAPGKAGAALSPLAWVALLPLVLAFWTKQSTLAALAASSLYLLGRNWRQGVRWSLVAGALLVVPFVLLNALLDGQLAVHFFLPDAEHLSPARLSRNLIALWVEHWPLLSIAAGTAVVLSGHAWRTRRILPLSLLYALISIPAVLLTNLSPHANYNHLLPALLPTCLLVGIGLAQGLTWARQQAPPAWLSPVPGPGQRPSRFGRHPVMRFLPLVGLVALLLGQPILFTPLADWYRPLAQPLGEKAHSMADLQRIVAGVPGHLVLAEDGWMALTAGKNLPYDDPAQMATQAIAGRWDESGLLAAIARHTFGIVILENDIAHETATPRWSPAVLAALQANYTTATRDIRFLEIPRPWPVSPPQPGDCPLAGGPRLVGFLVPGAGKDLPVGQTQPISLYWTTPTPAPARTGLKVSLRLRDPQGRITWQADLPPGAPAGRAWPGWPTGITVRDDIVVPVPSTTLPGNYTLSLSAYGSANGSFDPIPFTCSMDTTAGELILTRLQVIPAAN